MFAQPSNVSTNHAFCTMLAMMIRGVKVNTTYLSIYFYHHRDTHKKYNIHSMRILFVRIVIRGSSTRAPAVMYLES
jgi:hypothetical protein